MLRLLTEHWELKIIAVLVAFALWFFVATSRRSQGGAAAGSATVVPQVHGTPASGYAVQRVLVEPPPVRITGPRSTIETRGEASTFPARVTGEIAEDGMAEPQGAHAAREKGTSR